MTPEIESIEFLEHHVTTTFSGICGVSLIQNVIWLEEKDHARPYALMDSELILLFPPFISKSEIKS